MRSHFCSECDYRRACGANRRCAVERIALKGRMALEVRRQCLETSAPTEPQIQPAAHWPAPFQAARTLRAASSQALMRSMSGTSPLRRTRWPAGDVAKAMRSAHSFSASTLAMASAER